MSDTSSGIFGKHQVCDTYALISTKYKFWKGTIDALQTNTAKLVNQTNEPIDILSHDLKAFSTCRWLRGSETSILKVCHDTSRRSARKVVRGQI
jgi:hypothetical protein